MASQVPTEAPARVAGKTYWDKGWQKCKEQPFVPLGASLNTAAFIINIVRSKSSTQYSNSSQVCWLLV